MQTRQQDNHRSSDSQDSITTALESQPSTLAMRPTKINILPRTGSGGRYSALDTSPHPTGRRLGWKGVAICMGLFIGAVWIINPRQQYQDYKSKHAATVPQYDGAPPRTCFSARHLD